MAVILAYRESDGVPSSLKTRFRTRFACRNDWGAFVDYTRIGRESGLPPAGRYLT